MAQLSFKFLRSEVITDHDFQARVLVDGQDILKSIDDEKLGIDPVEFFAQKPLRGSGKLLIGRCACGVISCGDVSVSVSRSNTEVKWLTSHAQERFVFELDAYEHSVEAGASDVSWETTERTAERLVSALDYSQCFDIGLSFEWDSARWGKEKMTLSFLKGSKQKIFDVPWNYRDPNEAVVAAGHLLSRLLRTSEEKSRSYDALFTSASKMIESELAKKVDSDPDLVEEQLLLLYRNLDSELDHTRFRAYLQNLGLKFHLEDGRMPSFGKTPD
jgi:hypothetical protein